VEEYVRSMMRSARRRRSIFCDVVEYEYVENYEEE
jgi:hypothetical protein